MRRLLPVTAFLCLLLGFYLALPTFSRWREHQRRVGIMKSMPQAFVDVPQSQRALRRPTKQQLQAAFPGNTSEILEKSDELILYSVVPRPWRIAAESDSGEWFCERRVLGKVSLRTPAQKAELLDSFLDGIASPVAMYVQCFEPHHGLRAVKGRKVVDFLICFECMQFETYRGAKKIGTRTSLIGRAPEPTFDAILTQAKVPLSQW